MGWGFGGYGFAPYVSKAEKMARARKFVAGMLKKGVTLSPVELKSRKIATTWWGQAWNANLERYADFAYRLERGRSYVRNGSVIDLQIEDGVVTSMVTGSESTPYKIRIKISGLTEASTKAIIEKSRKSLDSMTALLSGQFPDELKDMFMAQGAGLFPSPKEIKFSCSCPDVATMCKHVAATMYGVAARLDEKPEMFFTLRGIKMDDFIGQMIKQESATMLDKAATKTDRVIEGSDAEVADIFGIQLDDKPAGIQADKAVASKPESRLAPAKARAKTAAKLLKKRKTSKTKSKVSGRKTSKK